MQDANGNPIGFATTRPIHSTPSTSHIHGAGHVPQKNGIGPFFDFQKWRLSGYLYFPDNGLGTDLSADSPYLYFVGPYSTIIPTSAVPHSPSSVWPRHVHIQP